MADLSSLDRLCVAWCISRDLAALHPLRDDHSCLYCEELYGGHKLHCVWFRAANLHAPESP